MPLPSFAITAWLITFRMVLTAKEALVSCSKQVSQFKATSTEACSIDDLSDILSFLLVSAVSTGMWSGIDDHVETEDFLRGHSLGRNAHSTDTNTLDDWNHQGGPNSDGATPNSLNTSPLFLVETQLQIVDLGIGVEPIGDYLEVNDAATASLSICNMMDDSVSGVQVFLESEVSSGIVVPEDPVVINNLASEGCTCITFPISSVDSPPTLHAIQTTLITPDEEVSAEAQVLVLGIGFDVELETLFGLGLVGINIESSDGVYNYTIQYDPQEIQVFDETSPVPLAPISESVTFTPVESFAGLHSPETSELVISEWKRKLLFGVANFLALEVVLLRTTLGTVSENGLGSIIKVLNAKGWKYTFNLVSKLLGRYHGMRGINLSLGSSIMSAYGADPPEGDAFFVGEQNTDPGDDGLTVEERLEIFFQDVAFSFTGPTHVVGRRVFTRVLADDSNLVYAEDYDVIGDDSIMIDAITDRLSYDVGDVVTVFAEAVHGREGPLSGCHGVLTAGIYPEVATAASTTTLIRDDGVEPDLVANDGIYSGEIEVTKEIACSGGSSLPVFVIAQHTYHELDTGEVPNFSAGFEELRITLTEESPAPDILAFVYDFEPEMAIGSESFIEIEVRNIGQASARNTFSVEAWMSLDATIDDSDQLLGIRAVQPLFFPDESVRLVIRFTVPLFAVPGDYFILIRTDVDGENDECNEENNLTVSGFTLLARPSQ